jgi:hypothetical protein
MDEGFMWMQQPASEKTDMQIPCLAPLLLILFQLVQMNHLHFQLIFFFTCNFPLLFEQFFKGKGFLVI